MTPAEPRQPTGGEPDLDEDVADLRGGLTWDYEHEALDRIVARRKVHEDALMEAREVMALLRDWGGCFCFMERQSDTHGEGCTWPEALGRYEAWLAALPDPQPSDHG